MRLATPATLVLVALLAVSGCGSGADEDGAPSANAATAVSVSDTWVKAVPEGMTGAFGVLANDSAEDVTVVSAASAAAGRMEIHETVMGDDGMVMQQKDGGLTIPAGGSATLEPGGDHLMLMEVTEPIEPGDEVAITLTFSDSSTLEMTATAKTFTGANEDYMP